MERVAGNANELVHRLLVLVLRGRRGERGVGVGWLLLSSLTCCAHAVCREDTGGRQERRGWPLARLMRGEGGADAGAFAFSLYIVYISTRFIFIQGGDA